MTEEDLANWQGDIEKLLFHDAKLREAMLDPSRIFNQDETAVEVGSSSQRVLAEVNTKILFSISGGSRKHVTASFLASADGSLVPPRLIYKGVRNVAEKHLKDLDSTGKSGKWKFSVSEKGYITRELFLDVCKDLAVHLDEKKISRPVILFLDGASPHISLKAAEFCKKNGIQPVLFKPNTTHLVQPLDLTFFSSLKKELKRLVWNWQCAPINAGQTLTKYSVVVLLREATEVCLQRADLLPNGFRRAGISPWNTEAPDRTKLLPGTIFQSGVNELMSEQVEGSAPAHGDILVNNTAHYHAPASTLSLGGSSGSPDVNLASIPNSVPASIPILDGIAGVHGSMPGAPNSFPASIPSLDGSAGVHGSIHGAPSSFPASIPSQDGIGGVQGSMPVAPNSGPASIPSLDGIAEVQQSIPETISVLSIIHGSQEYIPASTSTSDVMTNVGPAPSLENSVLEQTETVNLSPKQYWQGKTTVCESCSRRILNKFLVLHREACKRDLQPKPDLETIPVFSLQEKVVQLNKFEVVLLTQVQLQEFNKCFSQKKYDIMEPLFHSWLTLKLSTIPTESEALKSVLSAHTASNVPKRKQKRKQTLPTGSARYDPTSDEWVAVLEEQESRKAGTNPNKRKAADKENKKTHVPVKKPIRQAKSKPPSNSHIEKTDAVMPPASPIHDLSKKIKNIQQASKSTVSSPVVLRPNLIPLNGNKSLGRKLDFNKTPVYKPPWATQVKVSMSEE